MAYKDHLEAKMGAIRQWGEVTARDGTIAKMKEQLEKVTGDFIKKSTKIIDPVDSARC